MNLWKRLKSIIIIHWIQLAPQLKAFDADPLTSQNFTCPGPYLQTYPVLT